MNYLHSGEAERLGNAHPNIVPYQVFKTADSHIVVAVGNDTQFRTFCEFAGVPELPDDPVFATNASRVANREQVVARLAPIMEAQSSAHWLAGLERLRIGCGPINTLDQVFSDPHVKAREMVRRVPHPLAGPEGVEIIASPLRLSATPVRYRHHPPLLGEQTDAVLRELLEVDDAELAALRESGII
jgi:crotonobetainyl-CoA:carnitine CoA-transferase CaiB-like acyl-CoA transferase